MSDRNSILLRFKVMTVAGRKSFLVLWTTAIVVALISGRYFLPTAPLLEPIQRLALGRHPALLLVHIGCGIVALVLGPVQFVVRLRQSHPTVHRWLGSLYTAAVCIGAAIGLWLSPDTRLFLAQGLSDGYRIYHRSGIDPRALGLMEGATYAPEQFIWSMFGFIALSLVWLITVAMGSLRALQRRFTIHRIWMTRSYALTFAAVTVRVLALPLLWITRRPVLATALTFWSWLLNLIVAEWLLRRSARAAAERAQAVTAGA